MDGNEGHIYGRDWGIIHDGYFSNPQFMSLLIETVLDIVSKREIKIIADLGGGTGILLENLSAHIRDIPLIDIDSSPKQTSIYSGPAINASIEGLKRGDITDIEYGLLLIMRSVLHYFGKDGMPQIIEKISGLQRQDEIFIHQSASFQTGEGKEILNRVYKLMGTNKYYPTTDELSNILTDKGYEVIRIIESAPLPLTSDDLMMRYRLANGTIGAIKADIIDEFGVRKGVFEPCEAGFTAWLHYYIYVCILRVRG